MGVNIRCLRYGFEVAHGLPLGGEDSLLLLSDIAASSRTESLLCRVLSPTIRDKINASSVGSTSKIIVPPFCSKPRTRFNRSLPAFNDIHESIALFFTNSLLCSCERSLLYLSRTLAHKTCDPYCIMADHVTLGRSQPPMSPFC